MDKERCYSIIFKCGQGKCDILILEQIKQAKRAVVLKYRRALSNSCVLPLLAHDPKAVALGRPHKVGAVDKMESKQYLCSKTPKHLALF